MSDPEPIKPREAARLLRQELARRQRPPLWRRLRQPAQAGGTEPPPRQLGWALAALVLGVLGVVAAMPIGLWVVTGAEQPAALLMLLPLALGAMGSGWVGRAGAAGVAGATLGCVALAEAVFVFGWRQANPRQAALPQPAVQTPSQRPETESEPAREAEAGASAAEVRAVEEGLARLEQALQQLERERRRGVQREAAQPRREEPLKAEQRSEPQPANAADEQRKLEEERDYQEARQIFGERKSLEGRKGKIEYLREEYRALDSRIRWMEQAQRSAEEEVSRLTDGARALEQRVRIAESRLRELEALKPRPQDYDLLSRRQEMQIKDLSALLARARDDLAQARARLSPSQDYRDAVDRRQKLALSILELGGTVPGTPEDRAQAGARMVYVLRNGSEIRAVLSAETADCYVIQDEEGKSHEVKRGDVLEIIRLRPQ